MLPPTLDELSSDTEHDNDTITSSTMEHQGLIDEYFRHSKARVRKCVKKKASQLKKNCSQNKDTQLVLLVGQKNSTTRCPFCGTLYDSINMEDVRFHKAICKSRQDIHKEK